MLRAGFVGLGAQGGPIALRIVQGGFPLTVWARRPEVLAPYAADGAVCAPDLAALGGACDVIGICVFGDADLRAVSAALLPAMAAGGILLIHTTVHPDTIKAVAEDAALHGVAVLDAPVSGGGIAAAERRLTVLVGGDAEVLARARPIIDCYAGKVFHLGGLGTGATAKLVNNALMAANLALCDTAVRTGEALGLDRATLNAVIAVSSGASFAHTLYAGRGALTDYAHSVDLLGKDVALLDLLAARAGIEATRLGDPARGFFADVRAALDRASNI